MNTSIPKALLFTAVACTTASLSCTGGSFGTLLAVPGYEIAGEDDAGRLLLAVSHDPIDPTTDDFGAKHTYDLFALDLDSLEATQLVTDIRAQWRAIRANGRYVAWGDRIEQIVTVRKIGTPDEPDTRIDGRAVKALEGDRLAISRSPRNEDGEPSIQIEFAILDLATGTEQIIDNVWRFGGFALSGNFAAVMHDNDLDVEIRGLELGGNVDVVDLRTGERNTVAPNIRVSGTGGTIFADNGVFVWQEYRENSFKSKVRNYDPERDQMETIIQKLDRDARNVKVVDVRNGRVLVERNYKSSSFSYTLDLTDLAGATTRLIDRYHPFVWPSFILSPRISDRYVLWADPYNSDLIIYDTGSATTRRFDPRTLLDNQPPAPQPRG